ncbi:ATP-binding cassette domain-containing protein [Chryseobacterium shandongense]|uniref:ATP-binding cassette domain-containing protein n=1 Tax=Chryseobacterium shandongense TaxID=1493872 RepID=A0AAD0YCR1_9FLAO|nr:ATP-binding cassette domain-containing protein [Chryseobacterium shandongense]AZA86530.1 ATP-binding cassette domain-containing protein [Chryseobacterium shandongense]AZA94939.1 ATP-binding cassette domain-containing protein [Chryseobacterium shandongense]
MSKLHIDSVTKSYGSRTILKDIYLSCEKGKIVALIGGIGSGKSTLLQIIFGTLKGDSQFIKFNDQVLTKQSDRKNKIAYLPQTLMFPKDIKIKNLISLFCNEINTQKLFNSDLIQPVLNRTMRNLSGGERRMVEVLTIIHSDADFILLEEPYSGLSPILKEKIMNMIMELSQEKGFIISDFNVEEAIKISDEFYLLSNTSLKQMKDLKELQQDYYLPKNI